MGAIVAEALVSKHEREEQTADPRRILSSAELAECTCPDWCERDHELD
jgi:hypothetical protein